MANTNKTTYVLIEKANRNQLTRRNYGHVITSAVCRKSGAKSQ